MFCIALGPDPHSALLDFAEHCKTDIQLMLPLLPTRFSADLHWAHQPFVFSQCRNPGGDRLPLSRPNIARRPYHVGVLLLTLRALFVHDELVYTRLRMFFTKNENYDFH